MTISDSFFYQIWAFHACFFASCTAKHIFSERKSVVLHFLEDTLLRERRRSRKALHLAGIKPMTSRIFLCRDVLYRCATTTAPPISNSCFSLQPYSSELASFFGRNHSTELSAIKLSLTQRLEPFQDLPVTQWITAGHMLPKPLFMM